MKSLLCVTALLMLSSAFAEDTITVQAYKDKSYMVVEGIIGQVECNRPTGLGIAEVRQKKGKTMEYTWYKVDSEELCSREAPSLMNQLGMKATKLTEISRNNLMSSPKVSKITIADGYIIDIENSDIDSYKYSEGIKKIEHIGAQEAHNWYFQNRSSY